MAGKEIQAKTWVVLVPLPFQGHISPMLDLGTVLHSKGFSIIVMHAKFNSPNPLNYPDFIFMPLTFNINCEDSIIDLTTMNLLALLIDLNVDCKAPLKEILTNMMMDQLKLHDRLGCIIHDNLMNFCEDVARDLNLPSIMLRPNSATSSLAFLKIPKLLAEGLIPAEGHIVKWAPQKEVLAHRAVGGFLSHCGWNSTMESISEGVPVICYPCFGDQMANARYLIDVWGVGLELEHEIKREKVEIAVRRLMVNEEGKEIRQRAIHLKEKADDTLRKDGSSFKAMEELVKLIRNDNAEELVKP